jgi:glycosyltransferase involved in cell wall biosynthesis
LPELRRIAASEPADWFIAHAQGALPVAAWAARRWEARLGFDCEDLLSQSASDPVEIVKAIETTYVPRCSYVSVPSEAMGRKFNELYGVIPVVLRNVFPLNLADGMLPPLKRARHPKLRLHWFSQTIGSGRGIEDAIQALEFLGGEVELHLRGSLSYTYRSQLNRLASRCGVSSQLFTYTQVDHDELIRTMSDFDIGLALERPGDLNGGLTISNKIFSYLLAGLPVVATETPGQMEALSAVPAVTASYTAGDFRALANRIERWSHDPEALQAAQQSAWDLARETCCWEREAQKFLGLLTDDDDIRRAAGNREQLCAKS